MLVFGIVGTVGGLVKALYFPSVAMIGVYILIVFAIISYLGYLYQYDWKQSLKRIWMILIGIFVILYFRQILVFIKWFLEVIKYNFFLKFDEIFNENFIKGILFPIVFVVAIGFPIVNVIIQLAIYKEKSLRNLILLILIYFFPLLIRHTVNSLTSYCFIFFILYEFIFSYALKKQTQLFHLKLIILPFLAVSLFFASLFLEPNPLFARQTSTVLTNMTNWIQTDIFKRDHKDPTATGTSASIDGDLPTSDIILNKSVALIVNAKQPFSSYLRGYSLAHYSKNSWKPVENDYKEDTQSLRLISEHFDELGISSHTQFVKVHSIKKTDYQFVPYFPDFINEFIDDSYYAPTDKYLSVYDEYPLIANHIQNDVLYSSSYYEDYIQMEYLDVPADLKEKLVAFIQERQSTDLFNNVTLTTTQKIQEIHHMLTQETTYSLKTGQLPENKDFVEYFMFENKKEAVHITQLL